LAELYSTYSLFENWGLVLIDTKLVSPENSSRFLNLRIRSLELKESIMCLRFDAKVPSIELLFEVCISALKSIWLTVKEIIVLL